MKRIAVFCAVAFVLSACNNWGKASEEDIAANAASHNMRELKVAWNGSVSPESISKQVVIDNAQTISVTVKLYDRWEQAGECTASSDISYDDYIQFLTLLDKAHLDVYFPGSDCEPLMGTMGVSVTFTKTDGTIEEYTTFCEVSDQIQQLFDEVAALASSYLSGCTEESFAEAPYISPDDEGFCGESSNESCGTDSDCIVGCHSSCEAEGLHDGEMCTMIYRECENYQKFGKSCGCVDSKCQWK